MDLKLYSERLTDIYIVSNNAKYLYDTMRKSAIVQELAKCPTNVLIDEFNIRTAKVITHTSEIAELYAILIALTLKEVESFFKKVTEIKFEWFSVIATTYLNNAKNSVAYNNITVPPTISSAKATIDKMGHTINYKTI